MEDLAMNSIHVELLSSPSSEALGSSVDSKDGYRNNHNSHCIAEKGAVSTVARRNDIVDLVGFDEDSFEEADETLADAIWRTNRCCYVIFALTGLIWTRQKIPLIVYNVIMLLCVPISSVAYLAVVVSHPQLQSFNLPTAVCLGTAVLMQYSGLLVCTYLNALRLNAKYKKYELSAHRQTMTATVLTTLVALGVTLVSLPFGLSEASIAVRYRGTAFVMFVLECVMFGANMHFLFVDAQVSFDIISALINSVNQKKQYSIATLETIKSEVQRIVNAGYIANTALISTALSNVLIAFIMFILLNDATVLWLMVSYLFKEVIVAFMGLYYVACVNELDSKLDVACGQSIRTASVDKTQSTERKLELSMSVQYLQLERFKFPMVGMVLTRKDVALRFSIWLFGILISAASKSQNF
jgi:hypothetical protein